MSVRQLKQSLFAKLKVYLNVDEIAKIEKAYALAHTAHLNQKRASGKPYIVHPLEVAIILANLEQDTDSIAAALLHDTLEDCDIRFDDLQTTMGSTIANLVEGVTKLTHYQFASKHEEQAENFRKMLLAMAKDFRIIIVKLADRLHNMRTLNFLSKIRQIKISQETRLIYAPLAHRLGMGSIKWELEDLAFQVLEPEDYLNLKKEVALKRQDREAYVDKLIESLHQEFAHFTHKPVISGRPKHLYSIHQKMKQQSLSFQELYDIYGLRIITQNKTDCYAALGLLHTLFKPIDGRFKDYIALPKSNCYQSLHSIVIGPEGQRVEFQIRTQHMHEVAELGIASHWRYKEGKSIDLIKSDFYWIHDLETLHSESQSATELMGAVQSDLLPDEVFVFSPKGDVFSLKLGATALDFAYRVHSHIGHSCRGIKINGFIKPLNTRLKQGDQIEILCHKVEFPKREWLDFVTTRHARYQIHQWFKRQNRDEFTKEGSALFDRWLKKHHQYLPRPLSKSQQEAMMAHFSFNKIEHFYYAYYQGDISEKKLESFFKLSHPVTALESQLLPEQKNQHHVIVQVPEHPRILTYLARCCQPILGDHIGGIITLGKGIAVHQQHCANYQNHCKNQPERTIDVVWTKASQKQKFHVKLDLSVADRVGLLQDILYEIKQLSINVLRISADALSQDNEHHIFLLLDLKHKDELAILKKNLTSFPEIYSVKRL